MTLQCAVKWCQMVSDGCCTLTTQMMGDAIEWCNEAAHGGSACIILTSGCCAWIPYHIELAIQYAPLRGDAIVTIRWVLNLLTQDVVHTVTCWTAGTGCMHIHTYIHTEWVKGMGLTNNVQWWKYYRTELLSLCGTDIIRYNMCGVIQRLEDYCVLVPVWDHHNTTNQMNTSGVAPTA